MDELKVVKRDGKAEEWNSDKLIASITKAGVPVEAAQNIASQLADWAKSSGSDGTISSNMIRDKVIELMTTEYPAEADNYKAYKKV